MTGYTCTVSCFEVSSTGFISTRNKTTLTALHKLMRKDLKKSDFLSNLNSLVWYSSYSLWLSRETQEYPLPPFLIPHINLTNTMDSREEEETTTGRGDGPGRGPG